VHGAEIVDTGREKDTGKQIQKEKEKIT